MKTFFQRVLPYYVCTIFLLLPFAIFSQSSTDYFRSKQSGSWSMSTTWEASPDNVSWVSTKLTPGVNSKGVTIQTGHTVSLSSNITLQNLSIQGTLSLTNCVITLNNPGVVSGTGILKYNNYLINPCVPIMTWEDGSTLLITGNPGATIDGLNQSFSNLQWNCPSPTTDIALNLDNRFEVRDLASFLYSTDYTILTEKENIIMNFNNLSLSGDTRFITSKNFLYPVKVNIKGNLVMEGLSRIESSDAGDTINFGGNVSAIGCAINRVKRDKRKYAVLNFSPSEIGRLQLVDLTYSNQCKYLIPSNTNVKFGCPIYNMAQYITVENFGKMEVHEFRADPSQIILRPGSSLITDLATPATVEISTVDADWDHPMDGWHMISSPVDRHALSVGGFIPEIPESYDFFTWSEPEGIWLNQKIQENNITSFTAGKGFLVAYNIGGIKTFTGNLILTEVSFTNLSKQESQYSGYHLLGNPFTSGINWSHPDWKRSNISEVAHVWNESAENYLPITGPDGFIGPNQGFFIQVLDSENSIAIPPSARIHEPATVNRGTEANLLHFKVTNNSNGTFDETIIQLKEGALTGYDKWDGHKLMGSARAPQLYSLITEGEFASVNSLPLAVTPSDVQLEFKPGVAGEFKIEVLSSTLPGSVYLEDKITSTVTQLIPGFEYAFTSNLQDAVKRFTVHLNPVSVRKHVTPEIKVYTSDRNIYINGSFSKAPVMVHDVSGRLLFSGISNGDGLTIINATSFKKGIYLVTVDLPNERITRKVVL